MCRPREGESLSKSVGSGDERTVDRWVLVEELVPKDYRDGLAAGDGQGVRQLLSLAPFCLLTTVRQFPGKKQSKRISFLRSVRRKNTSQVSSPPRLNVSQVSPSPPSQQPSSSINYSQDNNSQSPIRADPSVYNRRNDASATTIRLKAGHSVHGGSPPIDNSSEHFDSNRIVESPEEGENYAGRVTRTSPKGKSGGGFLARMSSRVGKNSGEKKDEDGIMLAMSRSMSSEGFHELSPRTDSIPPPPPPKSQIHTPPLSSSAIFANGQSTRTSPISQTPHPFAPAPSSRTASPNISPSLNNDRSSFATAADTVSTIESEGEYEDDSAYDGIDENEIVLFRGSRSYPTDLGEAPRQVTAAVHPFSQSLGPSSSSSGTQGAGREVPSIVLQMPPSSLPSSPKAPADVPEDATMEYRPNVAEGGAGMRRESAHSDIVGMYDDPEDEVDSYDQHPDADADVDDESRARERGGSNVVRLTQYFGGGVVQGGTNGSSGNVRPGAPVLGGVVSG